MADETDYRNFSLDEQCTSKHWKTRVHGYEEAVKIFTGMRDTKSKEWNKFIGLMKEMVVDSNAVAQEKGLEATLIFVEKCSLAGNIARDIMTGIVQKCIAARKTQTRDLAVEITLKYIEIEEHEVVVDELIKGMEHTNPKIVAACVSVTTMALRNFGNEVVAIKPLMKKLAPLIADRDKSVRDEGKQLAVEIYRWIGIEIKKHIVSLPQCAIKELEKEFDELNDEQPQPTRFIKWCQEKQQHTRPAPEPDVESDGDNADDDVLIDNESDESADILGKMPECFYEKLDDNKWTIRKESLEALEKLLAGSPRLENGAYDEVVRALTKVVSKDSHVALVALAAKCLALLAQRLRNHFSTYAMDCIPALLDRFKEKKASVVTSLREAMDTIYHTTTLEIIHETVLESLDKMSPSVKFETASFLARAFAQTQPNALTTKTTKKLATALIKALNGPDPTMRDASAEALGTLCKLKGEEAIGPLLAEVDSLKLAKVKEFTETAEVKVVEAAARIKRSATAQATKSASTASTAVFGSLSRSRSLEPKREMRPGLKSSKKPAVKKCQEKAEMEESVEATKKMRPDSARGTKPASSALNVVSGSLSRSRSLEPKPVMRPAPQSGKKSAVKKGMGNNVSLLKCASSDKVLPTERQMAVEEIVARSAELFPPDILSGVIDSQWKNRLTAYESFLERIQSFNVKTPGLPQVLVRILHDSEPGLKETNFQVMKIKLDIMRIVAENYPLTTTTVDLVINEVTEKLADNKNSVAAADVLSAFAEAITLDYCLDRVLTFAFNHKSPKVQSESVNWANKSLLEFGFQSQPKLLIENVRKGVQSPNPTVRIAAIRLLGTMAMYMGSTLMTFFESEKPALRSLIQTELDKNIGEEPPKPVRGLKKSVAGGSGDHDHDSDDDVPRDQSYLISRVNISRQITESLLNEMSHTDWKTRNEGLSKLQSIINEAGFIEPSIGDLGLALASRLTDSNAKLAQTALGICAQLATAMGPPCKTILRKLFPGFLHALGDSKASKRLAAISCINTFSEKCGYKEFFQGGMIGMIANALKTDSPVLKSELWGWLSERLPLLPPKSIAIEELTAIVPLLYAHICDRNKDVRRNANEAVLGIMIHVGYESMNKALAMQSPVMEKDLQLALNKARLNLPEIPLPKSKEQLPIMNERNKVVRCSSGNFGKTYDDAGHSRVKDEEVDSSEPDVESDGDNADDDVLIDNENDESADILGKMPECFYEKLDDNKWTIRKESLEALEKLLAGSPRLENGAYEEVVRALTKVVSKDSHVALVALAAKCLALLAQRLRNRFSTYAMDCIPSLLDRFKEKKASVVTSLREAMDTIYHTTTLEIIHETVLESLDKMSPSVKFETASFLARAFAQTQPNALTTKTTKKLATALIKALNGPDPTMRDASAEALGTLCKLKGEEAIGPLFAEVDSLKLAKVKEFTETADVKVVEAAARIKRSATAQATKSASTASTASFGSLSRSRSLEPKREMRPGLKSSKKPAVKKCQEKAEIEVNVDGTKKMRPDSARGTKPASSALNVVSGSLSRSRSLEPKPVMRPAPQSGKKSAVKKGMGNNVSLLKCASSDKVLPTERQMAVEEIVARSAELFPPDILSGVIDSQWKNRLTAYESFLERIQSFNVKTPGLPQVLVRILHDSEPGLKETNFQVMKIKLDIMRIVAENYPLTTTTVDLVINEVTEKLADNKNSVAAANVLSAFAEAITLDYCLDRVLTFAFNHKSPKVQSESVNWANKSLLEFGFQSQPKLIIENVRKGVQSPNPTVRIAAIRLLGTMAMYMGSTLMTFFESEKPALRSLIQTELDKNIGEEPPKPVRGLKKSVAGASGDHDHDSDDDVPRDQSYLISRINISRQITESLLNEMSHTDWKTRNEGLSKLQSIINEAGFIEPFIGDLGLALATRLTDSNAKLAQTALGICAQLATAMGPPCKTILRKLFPGFLHALGDSKASMRLAAISCINTFSEKCGYKEFFQGGMIGMIANALKTDSPVLKSELWGWLSERLPLLPPKSIAIEELTAIVPLLYAHICDRNKDVRRNANEAVLGMMIHIGYESMNKALAKQSPVMKKDLQLALNKARLDLPEMALPKSKEQIPIMNERKKLVRARSGILRKTCDTLGGSAAKHQHSTAGSSRERDEEVNASVLLEANNLKNQRLIEEQKMHVLKWTFTTPRVEFIELLKQQMTTANVNMELITSMFHNDFPYHLKAIEALFDDLPTNTEALVCNLDIILKWISLRFYDRNPSVLIKGLDYLNLVFQKLVDMSYMLRENEGSSFIPHLVIKLSDPKDIVRDSVRKLLHQILIVYPVCKVFKFIIDGLKSNNARQRTGCLDEICFLIREYGLSACQPSEQIALKEIARQISDRDHSVRNASLNCLLQAYLHIGNRVFKLIGPVKDRELSMLNERLKRVKRTSSTVVVASLNARPSTGGQVVQPDDTTDETGELASDCEDLPPLDEELY